MTNIQLTSPIIRRRLTSQERPVTLMNMSVSRLHNWVTDGGDQMVTDSGDVLIFNEVTSGDTVLLRSPIIRNRLTSQEKL